MTDVQSEVFMTAIIEIAKRVKNRDELLEVLQRMKDQLNCESSSGARKRAEKTE